MGFTFSTIPFRDRIERQISPEPNTGCWLWCGAVGSHGYGQVRVKSGTTVVHKILYEEKFGCVPSGLELDHLCRVRCCVNPDHLEPVTRRENIMRGVAPIVTQVAQTHCKRGHLLSGNNLQTYKTKYGFGRKCRTCAAQYRIDNRLKIKARMRDYYHTMKGIK